MGLLGRMVSRQVRKVRYFNRLPAVSASLFLLDQHITSSPDEPDWAPFHHLRISAPLFELSYIYDMSFRLLLDGHIEETIPIIVALKLTVPD